MNRNLKFGILSIFFAALFGIGIYLTSIVQYISKPTVTNVNNQSTIPTSKSATTRIRVTASYVIGLLLCLIGFFGSVGTFLIYVTS